MMLSMRIAVMVCTIVCSPLTLAVTPWTWCYKKKFSQHPLQKKSAEQAFTKINLMPFTQLIFSWNAHMPNAGGYRFFVRVRDVATKRWSSWHRMAEWGSMGATTFYSKHADGVKYCHVRLEMRKGHYADGFQIKVEPLYGAPLGFIKMLTVSTSDLTSFEPEKGAAYRQMTSVNIPDVPAWSQRELQHPRTPVLCSPTSLCVLASYLSDVQFDPLDFVEGVFDKGLAVYGSWPCNIAYAFHATEGSIFFHVQRLHNFKSLYDYLRKGIPVVVSVRGVLTGAPKAYPGGHLLTVVGFDPHHRLVLCHDPAVWSSDKVEKKYRLDEFLAAWEGSHRLAYIGDPA